MAKGQPDRQVLRARGVNVPRAEDGATSGPGVLRPVDDDARRLAKTLLRTARSGALATLDPAAGGPQVTRTGVSTDSDGTPVVLVSALAAHTAALHADRRCALLLGTPGKGDPLAHPRISLTCGAQFVERDSPEAARIGRRHLAHNDKARLYAALPDFSYVRLDIEAVSLNAGFGRAYALMPGDLVVDHPATAAIAGIEQEEIAHMNGEGAAAVAAIARHFAGAPQGPWKLIGIDAEGIDVADGDDLRRIFFETPPAAAEALRPMLLDMARIARAALG